MSTAVDLYLEERRHAILTDLARDGRVTVAELSRRFGVSEVTIRSDLQALAEQGLVVRTHGGAVPGLRTSSRPLQRKSAGVICGLPARCSHWRK